MEQSELLVYVAAVLERLGIDYAVVGSFASTAWGEARFTLDIDIVVKLASAQLDPLLAAFPSNDFYASRSAAGDAIRLGRPFNVIHFKSGNKIDFMVVGDSPWAQAQIARRRRLELTPGNWIFVAAPEDVIIGKLIYHREGGSDKHLRDIAGILMHCGDVLDRAYVDRWATVYSVSDVWQCIVKQSQGE